MLIYTSKPLELMNCSHHLIFKSLENNNVKHNIRSLLQKRADKEVPLESKYYNFID
jgi:hypothetical protein